MSQELSWSKPSRNRRPGAPTSATTGIQPFFCLHGVVTLLKNRILYPSRTCHNHYHFIDELFLPLNYWKALKRHDILLHDDHMVDLVLSVYTSETMATCC
jgi:hypothetical protein